MDWMSMSPVLSPTIDVLGSSHGDPVCWKQFFDLFSVCDSSWSTALDRSFLQIWNLHINWVVQPHTPDHGITRVIVTDQLSLVQFWSGFLIFQILVQFMLGATNNPTNCKIKRQKKERTSGVKKRDDFVNKRPPSIHPSAPEHPIHIRFINIHQWIVWRFGPITL